MAREAPEAYAASSTASRSRCGSPSIRWRSLKMPGSPSSPLTTRYFGAPVAARHAAHFTAVGKYAPPRPARPAARTSSMTSSGRAPSSASTSVAYAPWRMASAMSPGSARPKRWRSIRRWRDSHSPATSGAAAGFAARAFRRRGTSAAVTGPVVSRGRPSRKTSTTGWAQHMPLQPAATTVNGRPRRGTSTRSASNVSRAPTASPHVPMPMARRAPVRRRSAARRRGAKRAAGAPAGGPGGGAGRAGARGSGGRRPTLRSGGRAGAPRPPRARRGRGSVRRAGPPGARAGATSARGETSPEGCRAPLRRSYHARAAGLSAAHAPGDGGRSGTVKLRGLLDDQTSDGSDHTGDVPRDPEHEAEADDDNTRRDGEHDEQDGVGHFRKHGPSVLVQDLAVNGPSSIRLRAGHVQRDRAEAEATILHLAQTHALHEPRQLGGGDETLHRPRPGGVGGAIAGGPAPSPRHQAIEVEPEQRIPARHSRPRDLERGHHPARHRHPAHLGQAGRQVGEVPQQECRGHAGERLVGERQRERVGGQERYARRVARAELPPRLAEHALCEVGADDEPRRALGAEGEGEVGGARGEVERRPGRRRGGRARDDGAPGVMATARHERVHPGLTPPDARGHPAHPV